MKGQATKISNNSMKKETKEKEREKNIIEALFPSFFNKQLLNLKETLQYKETYKEHLNLLHKTERVPKTRIRTTLNIKYKANPEDRLLYNQYCFSFVRKNNSGGGFLFFPASEALRTSSPR